MLLIKALEQERELRRNKGISNQLIARVEVKFLSAKKWRGELGMTSLVK